MRGARREDGRGLYETVDDFWGTGGGGMVVAGGWGGGTSSTMLREVTETVGEGFAVE